MNGSPSRRESVEIRALDTDVTAGVQFLGGCRGLGVERNEVRKALRVESERQFPPVPVRLTPDRVQPGPACHWISSRRPSVPLRP